MRGFSSATPTSSPWTRSAASSPARCPDRGRRHRRRRRRRRPRARRCIDAAGCVVTPGLVNTHHHLYQTLTQGGAGRAGRAALRLAEDALPDLGAHGARGHVRLGPARPRRAGALGLHDELRPPLPLPERRAARGHDRGGATVGIRFHPTRGAMSVGESAGGLPPDSLVEHEPRSSTT